MAHPARSGSYRPVTKGANPTANGAYSATKREAALEALSGAARMELAPFGIHVVLVEPGNIKTRFADTAESLAQEVWSNPASPYRALYQHSEHVATWLEPVRGLVKPVREGLFAGALHINQIPSFADKLKFRLSVMMGVWKEGDHRDWNAIRAWAASLRPLLA